ncbi:hypothetical protein AJ80_04329 [Polytolypa hystricis UAMH7299]|uniref:C2H2-type domain-containing protein n=1 Tax=Polytolypa hystricis (strain UAMH7299) TaxID=1447883 RepID=A0A2B7YCI8_POLH7|nr:hypothetical protein AJ80_04329 [Polytolypa hystricis UAMH7299]
MLSNPTYNLNRVPDYLKRDVHALAATADRSDMTASYRSAGMPVHNTHRRGLSLDGGIVGRRSYVAPDMLARSELLVYQHMLLQQQGDASLQRPSTPTQQASSVPLPLTPATTPFRKSTDFLQHRENIPPSPTRRQRPRGATIASGSMERAKSLQGVAGSIVAPVKARIFPAQNPSFFDGLDVFASHVQPVDDDVFSSFTFHSVGDHAEYAESLQSTTSPITSSFMSLPEIANISTNQGKSKPGNVPILPAVALMPTLPHTANSSPCSSPTKTAFSPRAMSIADLNLDATIDASIEETGITNEDIASFIEGPDPEDKKWVCTYNGCNKRFGRKENIKSHIQTHLGDRQFKCNHCQKCFVRGHDLKRHAKIHTGIKPYPCECGNSFARQDALTRHKQRGMCSGAFKGVVRKVVKRGRPRKPRPDMEERQDKATKTRELASEKSYAGSVTDSTYTSLASPPSESFESSSAQTATPPADLEFFNDESFGLPPDVFTFTPPASPGYSTGNVPSPSRSCCSSTPTLESNFLCLSPTKRPLEDIPEEIPDLPTLALTSPTTAKPKGGSPIPFLLPSSSDSTFMNPSSQEFDDVFTSQDTLSTLDPSQTHGLDLSSATKSSPHNDTLDYDTDLYLSQFTRENSDLNSQLFSGTFSQYSEDMFCNFSSEVENSI